MWCATSWPSIWSRTASRRIASPLASATKIANWVPDGYSSFSSSWLSSADMRRASDLISWICSSRPLICRWSDGISSWEGSRTAAGGGAGVIMAWALAWAEPPAPVAGTGEVGDLERLTVVEPRAATRATQGSQRDDVAVGDDHADAAGCAASAQNRQAPP